MSTRRNVFKEDGKPVIFIEPYTNQLFGDGLFDTSERPLNRDGVLEVWSYLRSECENAGIRLHTSDFIPSTEQQDSLFILNTVNSDSRLHETLGSRDDIYFGSYYLPEPPVDASTNRRSPYRCLDIRCNYYRRVYTSSFPEALDKLGNIAAASSTRHFFYPQSPSAPLDKLWSNRDRKFLVMINSPNYSPMRRHELYSERVRAISYFGARSLIDLYGHRWREGCAQFSPMAVLKIIRHPRIAYCMRLLSDLQMRMAAKYILKAYKGQCKSKYDTLSQYNYAICYENFRIQGFLSEKMMDCLFVGTIPVYWGDPLIDKWVPRDCFIDRRDYKTYSELHSYLLSLTETDREKYREAGRAFIESDRFYPFTKEQFAEKFVSDVRKDLEEIAGPAELAGAAANQAN